MGNFFKKVREQMMEDRVIDRRGTVNSHKSAGCQVLRNEQESDVAFLPDF